MKHGKTLLLLSVSFALISCGAQGAVPVEADPASTEKTGNLYRTSEDMSGFLSGYPKLSDLKVGEAHYRILDDQPLIPYMRLTQYEALFQHKYDTEKVVSTVSESGAEASWQVTVEGNPVFAMFIDFSQNVAVVGGALSKAYKGAESSLDPSVYLVGLKVDQQILNPNEAKVAQIFDFGGYDMDPVKISGKYYLPVGLLDLLLSDATGYAAFTTYKDFFLAEASSYTSLGTTIFYEKEGDTEYQTPLHLARKNAVEITGQSYQGEYDTGSSVEQVTFPVMPMYLRKYHRGAFYYMFDHRYGLASTRHIKSMKAYFEADAHSEALLDDDPKVRGEAMSYLIGNLNDGHTGLRTSNAFIWNEVAPRYNGPLWDERILLKNDLDLARKYAYFKATNGREPSKEEQVQIKKGELAVDPYLVTYSGDGKTAFFSFDQFVFALDSSVQDVYKTDTYYYFLRQFRSLNEGVENVVIDLSTNGGGIVIALIKILALISKNNSVTYATYGEALNQQVAMTVSVDSNGDGLYNAEDVYGDDYNIYLLCSPYSFSCGNAYPYLAQKQGLATIIGAPSGGGECAVGVTMLPSGQYIGHSSLTHIGSFEPVKNASGEVDHYVFEGDEAGASVEPKWAIDYRNYFDFDYLGSLIEANKAA